MEQKLTKKYGLFTAIAMVVGIVIGSGVFFKAQDILGKTSGNLIASILSWIVGGLIMMVCAVTFSFMATKYEKVNGIVDYAEATLGKGYAYYVGWFIATIYMPSISAVLAWVSSMYTLVFVKSATGYEASPWVTFALAVVLMLVMYVLNTFSPVLAGKFQVSVTVIKLIPLVLMAVVGVIAGLVNGTLGANFSAEAVDSVSAWQLAQDPQIMPATGGMLELVLVGLVGTAFAYDGWIIATCINAEIKDSKRNLPLALTLGSLIIVLICVLYSIGVSGGATAVDLVKDGATVAFRNVFGKGIGVVLDLFVALSCLGTLNGLMLASARTMYAVAARGRGPAPETFAKVDKKTNMPIASSVCGLVLAALWLVYFFGAEVMGWFGNYGFDPSSLAIITLYGGYIPIFILFMKNCKEFGVFKRFVLPTLAICGSLFMAIAAAVAGKAKVIYFLIVVAVFLAAGWLFDRKNKKN